LDVQRLRYLSSEGVKLNHFFDVGASNGCWSWRLSKAFSGASFDLFEPLIDHAPEYRELMEEMLSFRPRFFLHKVALGHTCKRTKMHMDQRLVGSTALELGKDAPREWPLVEVEMLTVDYVVEQLHRPAPQVIKIDTQGCELAILQGAVRTLPRVEVVLLECWLRRGYGNNTPLLLEVAEWLRQLNFHFWDFSGCHREEGLLVSQDCFFLNARSKASRLRREPKLKPAPSPSPRLQGSGAVPKPSPPAADQHG
jgi:FkbM family methyltransferase